MSTLVCKLVKLFDYYFVSLRTCVQNDLTAWVTVEFNCAVYVHIITILYVCECMNFIKKIEIIVVVGL